MKEKQANKKTQGDEERKAFSLSSSNATSAQPLELTPVVAMEIHKNLHLKCCYSGSRKERQIFNFLIYSNCI